MSCNLARSKLFQPGSSKTKMYLQSLMTVHVRGPGETGGAFGFALIFLFLFPSREKERQNLSPPPLDYSFKLNTFPPIQRDGGQ